LGSRAGIVEFVVSDVNTSDCAIARHDPPGRHQGSLVTVSGTQGRAQQDGGSMNASTLRFRRDQLKAERARHFAAELAINDRFSPAPSKHYG
jgi:hypothetical protein